MSGEGSSQNSNWPLPKFHFEVSFGSEVWRFQEVSGLESEVEVLEYRHGKSKQLGVFKMPGLPKYTDATLKKGVFTGDTRLFNWYNKNNTSQAERKDVTITLLNHLHEPEIVWTLTNAFPKKIESTSLNSQGSEIAVESIVLSYEELSIENI